eukprot:CAMPEP_0174819242 /NCGR_PEP_ID=MMETSP1107-20130205/2355_1 /TAXON_ID=36770 /ORGANISM="Paraphysomonas vestita, Strain GFlagA" /LENGTH=223 /DNA_ID=CAMNT_0016032363 /DNA_START=530 /DNA_END=1201 /DNA_ORIENTATION=+
MTSMDTLLKFHAWEAEQALRLMNNQVVTTGHHIETFVIVIDAAGWHMGLATTDAFSFIRGMSSTDSDHYPERLGKLVLINAPKALSFVWRMVSSLLDAVTLAKISVFSKKSEWYPELLSLMDEDQIPVQYGGTAKDFTPEEALQSMDPPQNITKIQTQLITKNENEVETTSLKTSSETINQTHSITTPITEGESLPVIENIPSTSETPLPPSPPSNNEVTSDI